MSGTTKNLIMTEYVDLVSSDQRIFEAEMAIKKTLNYYGCQLAVTIIKYDGRPVEQHIVVIDAREG